MSEVINEMETVQTCMMSSGTSNKWQYEGGYFLDARLLEPLGTKAQAFVDGNKWTAFLDLNG